MEQRLSLADEPELDHRDPRPSQKYVRRSLPCLPLSFCFPSPGQA
jgi:hypothetical protein